MSTCRRIEFVHINALNKSYIDYYSEMLIAHARMIIVSSQEGGRIHVRASAGRLQLEIKKLAPTDAGNYTCTSHNSAGNHSKTGSITVNCEFRCNFISQQQQQH